MTTPPEWTAYMAANRRAREEYRHHPHIAGGENRYFANCDHCTHARLTDPRSAHA